ncbi:CDP-glycerol glycerophosphotransferase family protein [Streptomyces polyrhachis]|uniref:CDP-glycerol glycerophosphotransferase family protein n=1 Tax=Streptomyces polyrhachis TaxID=1282885 RepID=A0ABW2GNL9_9ACTN
MAPRLSVIVPMYNVEEYLRACLDSLRQQTLQDIEVVMVDDGSPDGSAAIAAEYAAEDPRFKLVRKENGGLGAARNTGIDNVSPDSEFLTFVDSDDVIPPDAYRMMVASLDESGSDFVSGNVFHLKGDRTWQVPLFKVLAGDARTRTHISRLPRLVADRIACNKVFRRDFWEKNALRFPEGVLNEDIPVVMPAHYLAASVDTIGEICYFWRLREGEAAPSITQRRTEVKAIEDRVKAVQWVSDFLAEQARTRPEFAGYKRDYDERVLKDDLRLYLNVLPDADEEYRQAFLDSTNRYLATIDPALVMGLPVALRVQWILVRKRAMGELIDLLASQRRREPTSLSGLVRKYTQFGPLKDSSVQLPKKALRSDKDLEARAPLREVEWRDGKLVLTGDAYIQQINLTSRHSSVKVLQLKKDGSRRRTLLPAKNTYRPSATADTWQRAASYDWGGWEVVLDPAKLKKGGAWQEGLWHVGMRVFAGGLMRAHGVGAVGGAGCNYGPYHWLGDDYRMLPLTENAALKLRVEKVRVLVNDHRSTGDSIELEGELREPIQPGTTLTLRVANRASGDVLTYPVTRRATADGVTPFTAQVPIADIALVHPEGADESTRRSRRDWQVYLGVEENGHEREFPAVMRDGLADESYPLPAELNGPHNELAVIGRHTGYLQLSGRSRRARITGAELRDGLIRVTGVTRPELAGSELVLKSKVHFEERTVPVLWGEDGTFEASFDPSVMGNEAGTVPLKAGRWNFALRTGKAEGATEDIEFVIDRLALADFPLKAELRGRRYWLEQRWGHFVQLNCRSGLSDLERGPYRVEQLRREVYGPGRELPLRDQVFYLSYNGKQYSDSPRAMHEELLRRGSDLKHLWAVRDDQVVLPETAEPIRMWGTEWYEALARSRYIVTNAHLPEWVERRPGQVIVQTWHGTMLKKIGHDIETLHFDKQYQYRIALEANNWSLLVSSNRFSTPILKRAFSFDGEILEAGYPRNDYLYAEDLEQRMAEIKQRIGLPADKKVVLYAPTWRDDQSHKAGQFRFDLRLDLKEAQRRLGEDHVLLVRPHSNIVDTVPGAGDGFVWDMKEYPDIADLYQIADIMITDYSSVMFDYAHLKRPMLFFTYDLEHYRDTLRGFYFDFEEDSPGPLLRTSDEVIDSIRNIDEVAAEYQERFDRFHHNFCDLDDGSASARVVDRMLEKAKED